MRDAMFAEIVAALRDRDVSSARIGLDAAQSPLIAALQARAMTRPPEMPSVP
jgi:hypothetical protein